MKILQKGNKINKIVDSLRAHESETSNKSLVEDKVIKNNLISSSNVIFLK